MLKNIKLNVWDEPLSLISLKILTVVFMCNIIEIKFLIGQGVFVNSHLTTKNLYRCASSLRPEGTACRAEALKIHLYLIPSILKVTQISCNGIV